MTDNSDWFPFFTEHKLDSTQNSLVRNHTTKSVILAPFNSTMTHESQNSNDPPIIKKNKIIKFGVKVKDIDRQYEANNNWDLDNGVFNEFINNTDSDEEGKSVKDSISSLKRTEDSKMGTSVFETDEDEDIESIANDHVEYNDNLFKIMEKWGYRKEYLQQWLNENQHTYGTTGMHLIFERLKTEADNKI